MERKNKMIRVTEKQCQQIDAYFEKVNEGRSTYAKKTFSDEVRKFLIKKGMMT